MHIGIVKYTNAIPFLAPYLLKALPSPLTWTLGHPKELNQKMASRELELSLVSTSFYLQNKEHLTLVPGIGIGADGPVESVCLFYPEHLTSFNCVTVALDPESATSNTLLKWYLEKIRGDKPHFVSSEAKSTAFLLIGDRCLSFVPPKGFKKIDLAEEWKHCTNLPLPFAVLAAHKKPADDFSEVVQSLSLAVEWTFDNFSTAATLSSFPEEKVVAYWKKLRYHFDNRYTTALNYMERMTCLIN